MTNNILGIDFSKVLGFGNETDSVKEYVDLLKSGENESNAFARAIKNCSKETQIAVRNYKDTDSAIIGLSKSMNKASTASKVLNSAINIGIVAAIAGIAVVVSKTWDKINVTVKEVEESIDTINSKINDLNSEIKNLQDIENRNSYQQERLQNLLQELSIQERLLEIEQQRRAEEAMGRNYLKGDFFDEDNYRTKFSKNIYGFTALNGLLPLLNTILNLGFRNDKLGILSGFNNKLNSKYSLMSELDKRLKTYRSLGENESKSEAENDVLGAISRLDEARLNYLDEANKIQQDIDAGYYSTNKEMLDQAQYMVDFYNNSAKEIEGIIVPLQKEFGTFDYSSTIEGVLDKKEFEGYKDTLVQLGVDGKLSIELIEKEFSSLIPILERAGIDTEELYNYIMNLSDPKFAWRKDSKVDLLSAFGYQGGNKTTDKVLEEYVDSLSDEELEVAMKLVAEKDTTSWGIDDLKYNIEKAFEKNPVVIEAKAKVSDILSSTKTGIIDKSSTSDSTEYLTLDKAIDNAQSQIASYKEYITKLQNGTYTSEDLNALIGLDIEVDPDDIQKTIDNIESQMQTEFNQVNVELDNVLSSDDITENAKNQLKIIKDNLQDIYDIANKNKTAVKDSLNVSSNVQNLKSGMDMIGSIYKDVKDKGEFDWSSIINNTEFESAFASCGEAYDEFIQQIKDNPKDIKATQKSFDKLVTAYYMGADALYGLSKAEENVVKSQLKQQGITNYDKVVGWEYKSQEIESEINAKYENAKATRDLAKAEAESIPTIGAKAKAISDADKAYDSEIENIGNEVSALQNATSAEKAYYAAKLFSTFDFISGDIEQLEAIVGALGLGIEAWKNYYKARQGLDALANKNFNFSEQDARSAATAGMDIFSWKEQQLNAQVDEYASYITNEISEKLGDYKVNYGGLKDDASGGGSDAGDAYVEAFEKELEKLKSDHDSGLVSDTEYLARYKELIEKYFKGIDKYAQKYTELMKDYRDQLKGLFDEVISGVTSLLDKKINLLQEQQEEITKGLEEEKEAAVKAIEDQIDAIDDLIESKQDQIDRYQEEIDKINEAAEARQREIDLQKAQYELERAQSQRTRLVYKNGQMSYINDSSEIRDKKEEVESAKREIEIAALEKKIDLIQKEIDALEDEKEALDKQREAIEEYYDEQIKKQEEMFESMIKALEQQKSKWEELSEAAEIAEAYSKIQDVMQGMGYSVDDVLNDVPGAFEAFSQKYMELLSEMYSGNQNYQDGLAHVSDFTKTKFGEIASSAEEISKVSEPLNNAATSVENLGNKAGNAISNVSTLANNASTLNDNFTELDEKVSSSTAAIDELKNSLSSLGSDTSLGFGDEQSGLIGQFTQLENAINKAKGAIDGSGGAVSESSNGNTGLPTGTEVEGASAGLTGAIDDLQRVAEDKIGSSYDTEAATVVGDFANVGFAVGEVAKAIGTEDGDENTLTGTIIALPEIITEPINSVKDLFSQLSTIIGECATQANAIVTALQEASNTNISKFTPGSPWNFRGTAYASGKWNAKSKGTDGNSLVGELGRELIVHNDGTYETVGEHGAEFHRVKPSDIVFNAKQTEDLLRDGKIKSRGKAFANGQLPQGFTSLSPADLSKYQVFDKMSDIQTKLDLGNKVLSNIDRKVETIVHNEKTITNNAPVINGGINITCPGVTSDEVLKQVGIGLQKEFSGIYMNAYQRAMIK